MSTHVVVKAARVERRMNTAYAFGVICLQDFDGIFQLLRGCPLGRDVDDTHVIQLLMVGGNQAPKIALVKRGAFVVPTIAW